MSRTYHPSDVQLIVDHLPGHGCRTGRSVDFRCITGFVVPDDRPIDPEAALRALLTPEALALLDRSTGIVSVGVGATGAGITPWRPPCGARCPRVSGADSCRGEACPTPSGTTGMTTAREADTEVIPAVHDLRPVGVPLCYCDRTFTSGGHARGPDCS